MMIKEKIHDLGNRIPGPIQLSLISSDNCISISPNAFDQLSYEFCLNNLSVGYQGLSDRSRNQRQSGTYFNATSRWNGTRGLFGGMRRRN